jgi:HK97 gp10 family phage protein
LADEGLIGYTSLQGRLHALQSTAVGSVLMRKMALQVVAQAKRNVPRKTGNLGRSIHVGQVSEETAQVIASAGYAAFVEFGTRPHLIRPVTKKSLAWPATGAGARLTGSARSSTRRGGNGGMAFARIVHHPGTSPHPFMETAVMTVAQTTGIDVIVEAWNVGGDL